MKWAFLEQIDLQDLQKSVECILEAKLLICDRHQQIALFIDVGNRCGRNLKMK